MSATSNSFTAPTPIVRYDSFVAMTKSKRLPRIAKDISLDGKFLGYSVRDAALLQLDPDTLDSIKLSLKTPSWQQWVEGLHTSDCDQLPFLDFEYAWYANVLLRTGYFDNGIDPYRIRKWSLLAHDLTAAEQRFAGLSGLAAALDNALLGNQADLSQLGGPKGLDVIAPARVAQIDIDHPLAIVTDNFGREFLDDLMLALAFNFASGKGVHLHVKALPLFVSDTTLQDVEGLLELLRQSDGPFARAICRLFDTGDLQVSANEFWSSPLAFAMLPDTVGLLPDQTVIIKGDLNYRRAIGDAIVPAGTPFQALSSLPRIPMLSLRSVKSYCLAGAPVSDPLDFSMDGTLFLAQAIPGRKSMASSTAAASPPPTTA